MWLLTLTTLRRKEQRHATYVENPRSNSVPSVTHHAATNATSNAADARLICAVSLSFSNKFSRIEGFRISLVVLNVSGG